MFNVLAVVLSRFRRSQPGRMVLFGVVCLVVGAALFAITQHVSFATAMYWAITTATTVGYGDVTPKNGVGRLVAVGVMLTTIPLFASAFAFVAGAVASSQVRRLLGMVRREPTGREVMIFGSHPAVPRIATQLTSAGREVVVVALVDRPSLPESVRLVAGDATSEDVVRQSRPEQAAQLLVTGASDADVLVTAVLVHQLAPEVPMLAVAGSDKVARALHELGVASTVSADDLLTHTLAKSLEAPHAGELLLRLVDSDGYQLKELPVEDADVGRPLTQVRANRRGLVLGAVHDGRVMLGVAQDPVLVTGDHLLVLESDAK